MIRKLILHMRSEVFFVRYFFTQRAVTEASISITLWA